MKIIVYALNAFAFVTGIAAAVLWYLSSRVPYPDSLWGAAPIAGPVRIVAKPLLDAAKKSSKLNQWAAFLTAIAVLASALANAASALSSS